MNESFRILVVEDDPAMLAGTVRLLENAGYAVSQATNGEAALEAYRSQPAHLVLLDRDLPGIDGLEVCRQIKRQPQYVDALVVLVSASYILSEEQAEGLEAGADGYIARPIANRELLARVGVFRRLVALKTELRHKNQLLQDSTVSSTAAQQASLNLAEDAILAHTRLEVLNVELQKSEELLKEAQQIANLGSYVLNVSTMTWSSSAVMDRLFGIGPDYDHTLTGWMALIHPDDQAGMTDYFINEVLGQRREFNREYRIIRQSDQTVHWVWGLGKLEQTADGTILAMRGTIQDITTQKEAALALQQQDRLKSILLELPQVAGTMDEKAFMQHGLELAENLSASVISFLHFVQDDEQFIELITWSRRTLEKYCHVIHDQHYSVKDAGIWADAMRERKAVICNDYPSFPHKHGLPEGHSELQRLMSVPVIENDHVVMLLGVGNKATRYTAAEVNAIQLIGETIWRIVQRRRTQSELELEGEMLRNASDGINLIQASTGLILRTNPRFDELFGYAAGELIGQPASILNAADGDKSPEEMVREISAALAAGGRWQGELKNLRKDGTAMWCWASVSEFTHGELGKVWISAQHNVTATRESRERLRKLSRVIEQAPLSIVITDLQGSIEYVNPRFIEVSGYAWSEVLGRNPRVLKSGDTPPEVYAEMWRRLKAGQIWSGELRNRRKNGEIFLESSVIAPVVDDAGRTTNYVALKDDITAQRRFVAETTAQLAKEKEISEMKSRFISVTSHEFRTPIAAAMGSAEILINHLDRLAPAKRQELLGRITHAMHRMTEMLDEVLLLNRMEAHRVEVQLAAIDLRLLLSNVIEEIRLGDQQGHEIVLQAAPDLGPFATDANLLNHILSNLMSNAGRYSPAHSVITLRADLRASQLVIEVEDQGIGILAADQARIFEPFERGSNVGTIKGTGLGLSIVKRMVGLLGGTITLTSPATATGGTRFTLVCPVQPEPPKDS